jgi:hypothetical protein
MKTEEQFEPKRSFAETPALAGRWGWFDDTILLAAPPILNRYYLDVDAELDEANDSRTDWDPQFPSRG